MSERTCQMITKLSFESQQKNSILQRNSVSVSKWWQINYALKTWNTFSKFTNAVLRWKIASWKAFTKTDFWHFRTFVVFENIYDPSKWWTFCSIESLTTEGWLSDRLSLIKWPLMTKIDFSWSFILCTAGQILIKILIGPWSYHFWL